MAFSTPVGPTYNIVGNGVATAIGAIILTLVFLLGVPGNLFIIWSILARARKQSVTTLLILNLAYADGSLMALTPFFIVYLVQRTWVFGNALCKILFYLCLANMYASILLITLMSLHRVVAIVWPQRVRASVGRRVALWALVGVWVLVMVASVPAVVFRKLKLYDAGMLTGKGRMVCDSFHQRQSEVVLQYTMELVLGFIIPYPVIVISYVCILRRIRQTKFRRRVRSEKLILAIVVTFCVFWLPYHLVNLVQVGGGEPSVSGSRLDAIWQPARAITSALAFISSCANPVLYVFAGKSFIRRDGLAFMARLFEGTALDSGVSRKSRQHSRQDSRERDGKESANCLGLQGRDGDGEDSSYAAHSSSNQLSNSVHKNGKPGQS
uniref:Leukotriene B4 receptor 2a n=1 Tax=Gadus morhua TaxID=8049 RepID=A0A8C5AUQ8_GADMO